MILKDNFELVVKKSVSQNWGAKMVFQKSSLISNLTRIKVHVNPGLA